MARDERARPTRSGRLARLGPGGWRRAGVRIFSSGSEAPRARRPTDVFLLILAVLAIVVLTFPAPGPTAIDRAVSRLVAQLPGLAGWFWEISYDLLIGWALVLIVGPVIAHGRKRLLWDEVLAVVASFGFAALAGHLAGSTWSEMIRGLLQSHAPPEYPAMRLAVATAVVVTASPHLTRPLRYIGRWVIGVGAIAAIAIGIAIPIGILSGCAVGVGAAALVHLLRGSPGGRPTLEQVADALQQLGVEAVDLRHATLEERGVALVTGSTSDGRRLLIKIYGRDAWEGQFFAAAWLRLWHRDEEQRFGFSRLQQVEHEALMTMWAERAGVPAQPVVAVGTGDGGDALLVVESLGRPLITHEREDLSDELLHNVWTAVERLHGLGMAHGQIDGYRIVVPPQGGVALSGLDRATVAATDAAMRTDRAQLLVTTALAVGSDRAVLAAVAAIGKDGLGEILPYLQPAVLDRPLRRAVREGDWDVDDLRSIASEAAGVEAPKLEQIRRVTGRSIAMAVLIGLIAYSLISSLAGVGIDSIVDQLKTADAAWLVTALLFSPVVQVGQAFASLGASIADLRFGPVLMLQYAVAFVALAVPSTAARLALEVRFFQRNGVEAGGALSIALIDGVCGFVLQVILILVITLSGLAALDLSASTSSSSSSGSSSSIGRLLILLAALLVLGALIALLIPRYRAALKEAIPRIRSTIRAQASSSAAALRVLRVPKKLGLIFGGSFFAQLIQASILGMCLEAFGYHSSLAALILVNTVVSLFAGFMPVPGGMGVAEAGYTAGLVALGIPNTPALATALAFRLVTFYLPPIWGTFAMRWLRRHAYL